MKIKKVRYTKVEKILKSRGNFNSKFQNKFNLPTGFQW